MVVDVGEKSMEGDAVNEPVPGMAEAIERRMTKQGLTPTTFAQRAGLTPQGLDDVRAGKPKQYQAKTTIGVARALRWPADWYTRLTSGEDPNRFPDSDHPDPPGSIEDRVTVLEGQVRDLVDSVRTVLDRLDEADP